MNRHLRMLIYSVSIMLLITGCTEQEDRSDTPAGRVPVVSDTAYLVLSGAIIIDCTGAPAQPDMTVVIGGNRITALGKTDEVEVPEDAQVVDATGKYVIPGLWDMHIHSSDVGFFAREDDWFIKNYELNKDIFFPLFISNGITGVRDVGGNLQVLKRWRKKIEQGKVLGPRIILSGNYLIDPNHPYGFFPFGAILIKNEDDARRAVIDLKNKGADFIKIISMPSREAFYAVADEAKKQGITFVGHANYISAAEASDAGQKSIEHLGGIFLASSNKEEEYDRLFKRLKKNHTFVCPTLALYDRLFYNVANIDKDDNRLRFIPHYWIKNNWLPYVQGKMKNRTPEDFADDKKIFYEHVEVVSKMHRAGVKLLAGTDTAAPYLLPGFSLHEELVFLVKAGLTPMEALQTATLNPAKFLGMLDSLGTIEVGKIADLVLLDGDPLKDISNTQRINAVVVGGKYLPKKSLQEILADVEAAVRTAGYSGN